MSADHDDVDNDECVYSGRSCRPYRPAPADDDGRGCIGGSEVDDDDDDDDIQARMKCIV